eukprot:38410-Chlamydomonas_euryale.AAC.1
MDRLADDGAVHLDSQPWLMSAKTRLLGLVTSIMLAGQGDARWWTDDSNTTAHSRCRTKLLFDGQEAALCSPRMHLHACACCTRKHALNTFWGAWKGTLQDPCG